MYNNVQVACVCVCEFGCFVEENQLTPMMNAVAAFVPVCDNERRFYVFFKCEGNAKPKRERERNRALKFNGSRASFVSLGRMTF